jgi:hypothetical protein
MFIKWVNRLVVLALLFGINTVIASESAEHGQIHPYALDYCDDLTLNKKILIGHHKSGGYSMSMKADLAQYDQHTCQQLIHKFITTQSSLELTASPLVFDFYPTSNGQLLPVKSRTFDYSFICSSTQLSSITLSAADRWDVLNCIKNKAKIRAINLSEFKDRPLDLRLLGQFPNLEILSLASGELIHTPALAELTSLAYLSLDSVNIDAEQFGDIAQLVNLTNLKIKRVQKIEVRHFTPLKKLESLELVAIADKGIKLVGLEKMQGLTHLNLQGSQLTDAVYSDILQLNRLQKLNLADNMGITTVAPLNAITSLKQLTISGTSVSDLAPLAAHQGLFSQGYNLGYSVHFAGSKVVDLTSYYEAGGVNSDSSELLGCSPTSRKEYLAGKRCNERQRRECKVPGYGLIDYYIRAPFCVWRYDD